jgi:hypothetical protein
MKHTDEISAQTTEFISTEILHTVADVQGIQK